MKTESRIIEAVRAKGNDADDLRDAVHEAAHVMQIRRGRRVFRGPWHRENTHTQLLTLAKSEVRKALVRFEAQLVVYEFEARAVEWVVCDVLRIPYEVDHWVDIMLLETIQTLGIVPPGGVDANRNRIETYRNRRSTKAIVEKVLAL